MTTIRLTMAQALVRFLLSQYGRDETGEYRLFAGVFAIFGHGNVAGLGEALEHAQPELPTYRAHNEQAMAHAAIAFAKAYNRKRMMACTTSIGPGATNMVTAAALAHVNRLPVLLLPGDVFANRGPDPVLQQLEVFSEPGVTANDCFRPVSRYWDRITRPEQLLQSLPAALRVLTDPADCGPATIALPQDVQAEVFDYPESFFAKRVWNRRRQLPDATELELAAGVLAAAKRPLVIAGGGVHYAEAWRELDDFCRKHEIPVAETQAGKGALAWNHPANVGSVGVTGAGAANELAARADVVLAVGTRLTDFTTASRTLFQDPGLKFIGLNVTPHDAHKHGCLPLVCDARLGLGALSEALIGCSVDDAWRNGALGATAVWNETVDAATGVSNAGLPTDAQVLGAVNRACGRDDTVVCAAGGLPGELHKLWRARRPGAYHLEYGYSCMGYEIAGGLGVRLARADGEVFVLVGDGSYLMLNSEISTSVMLGCKLIVVVLDNRGFACINRLQKGCGAPAFNNLFPAGVHRGEHAPIIDFAGHAAALGAESQRALTLTDLTSALAAAKRATRTTVIVIETDPASSTAEGGAWWDVPVPEMRADGRPNPAFGAYLEHKRTRKPSS